MATEMTVTAMIDKIAKLKNLKRDEARDYMIRVAFGRINALLTYAKESNKSTRKAARAKPIGKDGKAKKAQKAKAPKRDRGAKLAVVAAKIEAAQAPEAAANG
jgi:hypothetical protein